jgi:serine/threonine protein kinase
MLYAMVLGVMPFTGETEDQIVNAILKKKLRFNSEKAVSKEFKDLIDKILTKEPENRISMYDLQNHPWIEISEEDLEKSIEESKVEKDEEDKKREEEEESAYLAKLSLDDTKTQSMKVNVDERMSSLKVKNKKYPDLKSSSPRLKANMNGGSFSKKKGGKAVKKKKKVTK